MITLASDPHDWIRQTCHRFADVTGWPMQFVPRLDSHALLETSEAGGDAEVCYRAEVRQDDQLVGHLTVDLPGSPHRDSGYTTMTGLADALAELIERQLETSRALQHRTQELGTLVDLGRAFLQEEDLPTSLRRLLRASLQLSGLRAAAFFLLNPETNQLSARAVEGMSAGDLPALFRSLTADSSDLQALQQGSCIVRRQQTRDAAACLPNGFGSGVCLPVVSTAGPFGTIWAFDRRDRGLGDRELHVLESFAAQVAVALERAVLLRESVHQHRLRRDVRVAAEGQSQGLIGEKLPEELGIEVAGLCTSRFELGGDLCEVFAVDADRCAIAVGDAAGDSVPAAMVMSAVRGAIRGLALASPEDVVHTERIMSRINRALYEITPAHQFMSLLFGVIDSRAGTFTYTNAGHPTPLLFHNGQPMSLTSHGLLLGVIPDVPYERSTLPLHAEDLLVLFSDGVTEAMSGHQQMFRSNGVIDGVRRYQHLPAAGILKSIWSEIDLHISGSNTPDDRTLLVVKFRPSQFG